MKKLSQASFKPSNMFWPLVVQVFYFKHLLHNTSNESLVLLYVSCRSGVLMRALPSYCGLGLTPGPGVIYGLSLFLVLVLALRVDLQALWVSSLHIMNILNSNLSGKL